ncbi:protein tilB homolog isoform X2 [Actinia tenebrosa]|uniref:Protein tilB homolog isoform X2 n=1 Tax=Actinia tenebrosa TaxID=6105 RepID=A0A6P8H3S0_ACTTE|nr:protein tilB homolog isoform X2 [Actinia tenebrosa]
MVRITEDLLRKRAEHNNCEIFTLEEISLHQSDIERIELLDKFCRDLKIIYLQSNLIPKIENVARLKKLEYLNLALNNVTRIENLEGCESLQKLDLTINFIGELTSIQSLRGNYNLRELYLTGNPCTDYKGYREYTIATLPNLKTLDGKEIDKSERILALQNYDNVEAKIQKQQNEYLCKQEEKRKESEKEMKAKEEIKKQDEKLLGIRKENWYTDIPGEKLEKSKDLRSEEEKLEAEKRFWEEKVEYTPESRLELHKHIQEKRKEKENTNKKGPESTQMERVVHYFSDDGRPLNMNQGKWNFHLEDDEDNNAFVLDFSCYKHLDISLMDVDVQPKYVRITIKGKVFQLVLSEEVNPDSSTAKRSQTTGHLLITMPKMKQVLKPIKPNMRSKPATNYKKSNATSQEPEKKKTSRET